MVPDDERHEVQTREPGGTWTRWPDQPEQLTEFEANAHMAHVRGFVDNATDTRVAKVGSTD